MLATVIESGRSPVRSAPASPPRRRTLIRPFCVWATPPPVNTSPNTDACTPNRFEPAHATPVPVTARARARTPEISLPARDIAFGLPRRHASSSSSDQPMPNTSTATWMTRSVIGLK